MSSKSDWDKLHAYEARGFVFVPPEERDDTYKKDVYDYITLCHKVLNIPAAHTRYLEDIAITGCKPKVIYDIGACVLSWSKEARRIWSNSTVIHFEANPNCEQLYIEQGLKYHMGVLSNTDDRDIEFYLNDFTTGGNSYYREIGFPLSLKLFTEQHIVKMKAKTLDTVVIENHFLFPDLIKLDIQGAELDVLFGAPIVLAHATDIIVEMQHENYNLNAPKVEQVTKFLQLNGFKLVKNFTRGIVDGDYHFKRV